MGTSCYLIDRATKSLGDGYGNIPYHFAGGTDCSRVNLGGIEDPYGWQSEMIQGVYFGTSDNAPNQAGTEVYIYEGNRMPITAELATHPAGAYQTISKKIRQWIRQFNVIGRVLDLFAKTIVGGGSTSYWADYFYGSLTGQLLLWGGYAYNGTYGGLGSASSISARTRTRPSGLALRITVSLSSSPELL